MKVLILWSNPSEEAKATLCERVQEGFDVTDEDNLRDLRLCYLGEASCCAPQFYLCLPDDTNYIITDQSGCTVEPNRVIGPLP
jgi:hypothetical protein